MPVTERFIFEKCPDTQVLDSEPYTWHFGNWHVLDSAENASVDRDGPTSFASPSLPTETKIHSLK